VQCTTKFLTSTVPIVSVACLHILDLKRQIPAFTDIETIVNDMHGNHTGRLKGRLREANFIIRSICKDKTAGDMFYYCGIIEINSVYFGLLMEMYCMSELLRVANSFFPSSPQGQDLYFQMQISGG
jgi:hypothetical protein